MNRKLVIEYEMFEETEEIVLSVVDKEQDEVLNMFNGKAAENIYRILSGEETNTLSSADCKGRDDAAKIEMKKSIEAINHKMNLIMEDGSSTKEFIQMTFKEIRELVDYIEKLALEGASVIETT